MNREDFNKKINEPSKKQERIDWLTYQSEQHKKTLEHYQVPFTSYVTLNEAFRMVKEIHDDFESRACSNCKHFETRNDYFNECMNHESPAYKIDESIPRTISCGEFERK